MLKFALHGLLYGVDTCFDPELGGAKRQKHASLLYVTKIVSHGYFLSTGSSFLKESLMLASNHSYPPETRSGLS